ncbi:hypothetical protein LCL95_05780 [Bacillus timonensis]|nr:hypothetical protein [Bacillus timonensis]
MLSKLIISGVAFLFGYVVTKWIPIPQGVDASDVLIGFILSPVKFFAAMVCFFISFFLHSILIKRSIELTYGLFKGEIIDKVELVASCFFFVSFFILFQLGFWQTMVLLVFSTIYGIISLDFRHKNLSETN